MRLVLFVLFLFPQTVQAADQTYQLFERNRYTSFFFLSAFEAGIDLTAIEFNYDFYRYGRLGINYGLGDLGTTIALHGDLLFPVDRVMPQLHGLGLRLFLRGRYAVSEQFLWLKNRHMRAYSRFQRNLLGVGIEIRQPSGLTVYTVVGAFMSVSGSRKDSFQVIDHSLVDNRLYPVVILAVGVSNATYRFPKVFKANEK